MLRPAPADAGEEARGRQPRLQPEAEAGPAVPLDAVDMVPGPSGGVVIWNPAWPLGCTVPAGAVLGWVLDPSDPRPPGRGGGGDGGGSGEPGVGRRTPIVSRTAGLLFARRAHRLARPGMVVAKIAGEAPLPHRAGGNLLTL